LSAEKLFDILRKINLQEEKTYSSNDIKQVANQGGMKHVLVGDLAKAGETFRLNITLQEAYSGETVGSESAEGRADMPTSISCRGN
jgi:TolB-like protein